jgi:2-amino-4-hydroxy-6-hydroxymethyldihydropteridine diphosphokinase
MPRCYISLGGNQGPVAEYFTAALDQLRSTPGCSVVSVSPIHETAAVGDHAGGSFLNAAAAIDTALEPITFLDLLQSVENELGRRRIIHWGPRPIDLDLLYYDDAVIDTPRLVVPHPAAWYRRFVLDPLVEIAPDLRHPVKQATMRQLRDRMLTRPFSVALAGGAAELNSQIRDMLRTAFTDVLVVDWEQVPARTTDPAFIFWLGAPETSRDPHEQSFERLPLLPRLDVTKAVESPCDFVRYVIQSAIR